MKKTVRILSLILAVLMLSGTILTLIACGDELSGEYVLEDDDGGGSITLKFSGDTVTFKYEGAIAELLEEDSIKFTYKIVDMTAEEKEENEGFTQKIQWFYEDEEEPVEQPFSKGKKSITIGDQTFKKK